MENYKIIVRKDNNFYISTFDNRELAKMAYNGILSAFKESTNIHANVLLVHMDTQQVVFEAIVDDGTIYEQYGG